MHKIALTGGPCAGKSTALQCLSDRLEGRGFQVVVAPEAATQVINEGVMPGTLSFQRKIFQRQLELEDFANHQALISGENTIAIYDRSLFDQLAYISWPDFNEFLKDEGLTVDSVISRYDGLIHLVSASVGTEAYTTENNSARRESLAEAQQMEAKTWLASQTFPGVIKVDNSTDFQGKMARVLAAVEGIIHNH